MNPLISIIIPEFQDGTYLLRCLNSIKRQSYNRYEVIFAGDEKLLEKNIIQKYEIKTVDIEENKFEGLNKSIEIAEGEFIFFCDINTVLSSDFFDALLKENRENFVMARCLICDDLKESLLDRYTIYGKLFSTHQIKKLSLKFDKEELCPIVSFTCRYLKDLSLKNVSYNVSLYISDISTILENNELVNRSKIESFLELVDTCELEEVTQIDLLKFLVEKLYNSQIENRNEIILQLAMYLRDRKEMVKWNYDLARVYMTKIFDECIRNEDEELWEMFQKYFSVIQDKYFEQALMDIMNLDEYKIELIRNVSVGKFIFYSQILKKKEDKSSDNNEILKGIERLESKIKNEKIIEKVIEKPVVIEKVKIEKEFPCGIELGNYVLQETLAGRLGLKYILKIFVAWIKFKCI